MRPLRLLSILSAVAVLAAAGWCLRGYITDDTYIHLRYAENLLHRGEFSFNPGEHSYGATSPLWIFGLGLLLTVGVPPLVAAWVLGALCGLGTVLLGWAILQRLDLPPAWRVAALLLIAGDVWFLRWTFSGMETPLATFLLLALLWPLCSGKGPASGRGAWPRHLAWGVAAGLAGLVRPEFLVIAPLAWPWLSWAGRRFSPVCLAAAVAGWLAAAGPWLLYASLVFGRFTPGTASAKSAAVSLDPGAIAQYVTMSLRVLGLTQGVLWLAVAALALVLSVAVRRGPARAPNPESVDHRPGRALAGIALTWAAVLMGAYALKQVWIISRYLSPLAPPLILTAAIAGRGLQARFAGRGASPRWADVVLGAGVVLALVINGLVFVTQVVPHARTFPDGIARCYVGLGEWIGEHTEPEAVVAALDIGAVGYASDRRVLDLMGLVSPEILALGADLGFQEMVDSGAWLQVPGAEPPDYFLDRSEGAPRWAGRTVHGVRFELLDSCLIEGVGLREPQPWTVALYRLIPSVTRTSPSDGG